MTVDILGEALNDDIGAKPEWLLQIWSSEGIVDDQRDSAWLRQSADRFDIRQAQSRIIGRFEKYHGNLRVFFERLLDQRSICCIDKMRLDAEFGESSKKAVSTAIDAATDDFVATFYKRQCRA